MKRKAKEKSKYNVGRLHNKCVVEQQNNNDRIRGKTKCKEIGCKFFILQDLHMHPQCYPC